MFTSKEKFQKILFAVPGGKLLRFSLKSTCHHLLFIVHRLERLNDIYGNASGNACPNSHHFQYQKLLLLLPSRQNIVFFLLGIISECLLDTLYANNMKYLTASTQLELDLN